MAELNNKWSAARRRAEGCLLLAAVSTCSLASSASDVPSRGVMYGGSDKDYIQYHCSPLGAREIECDFTQLKVRSQAKMEELPERLKAIPEALNQPSKKQKADCLLMKETLSALEGGSIPSSIDKDQFLSGIAAMSTEERADAVELMKSGVAFFCDPSEATAKAFVERSLRKETRTCKVMAHSYQQKFSRSESGGWVSASKPLGQCGKIVIAEFEKERVFGGEEWLYRTRKIATNLKGTDGLVSCNETDQTTYTYSSEKAFSAHYRGCDYIEYGF